MTGSIFNSFSYFYVYKVNYFLSDLGSILNTLKVLISSGPNTLKILLFKKFNTDVIQIIKKKKYFIP